MRCKDLEELLGAHANGELASTQRDFLDEHLAACPECRATLADYTRVNRRLLSLQTTASPPDMKWAIMSRVRALEAPSEQHRRRRLVLTVTPVAIVLVALLSLQLAGVFTTPRSILARAYSATEALTSYRLVTEEWAQETATSEPVLSYRTEIDYAGPRRFRVARTVWDTFVPASNSFERILIDDEIYVRSGLYGPTPMARLIEIGMPSTVRELPDTLVSVETLADEKIDGILCYHYRGVIDREKMASRLVASLRESLEERGIELGPEWEQYQLELSMQRQTEMEGVSEWWIGKDDYLIHQWRHVTRILSGRPLPFTVYELRYTGTYSDISEEIVIQPPLDESGELLEGWH